MLNLHRYATDAESVVARGAPSTIVLFCGGAIDSPQQSIHSLGHLHIPPLPNAVGFLTVQGGSVQDERHTCYAHALIEDGEPTEGGEYDMCW